MKTTLTTIPSHKQQKFYTETHHINGQVMVYKGTHSKNYYVRYSTVSGYVTKSLRTPELTKAKAKALELGELILTRHIHGLTKTQTIASITEWYTKSSRYTSLSTGRQKQIVRIMRIISEYFKSKNVDTIKYIDWADYYEFRHCYYNDTEYEGKAMADNGKLQLKTLRQDRNTFHQVMGHAHHHGLIHKMVKMPDIPSVWVDAKRNQNRPDATFTPSQYAKYRKALNNWVTKREENYRSGAQGTYAAHMVRAILWTIRHSGGRVKEITRLLHSDLEVRTIKLPDGTSHETFAIFIDPTKSSSPFARYAIMNYSGYKHLLSFIELKKQLGFDCGPDQYLFPVYRDRTRHYDSNLLGTIFRKIVQDVGLYIIGDKTNPTRATPRMLRRYYIIRQIDAGTPVEHIAMAVGHKIETAQRYYNSVMRERYEKQVFAGSYYPATMDNEE